MSYWASYICAVSKMVHLTPHEIMHDLPYAQGLQFQDLAMQAGGVELVPSKGSDSPTNQFLRLTDA